MNIINCFTMMLPVILLLTGCDSNETSCEGFSHAEMIDLTQQALSQWNRDVDGVRIGSLKAVYAENESNYNQAVGWLLPFRLKNSKGRQVASLISLVGCDKRVEFSVESIE